MHSWGDPDVDWDGIDDAARFIGENLRKWRVDVRQYKEKFGTVRVYCSFGIQWWPQITHPGYVYNQWPKWLDWWVYCSYRKWHPGYWILRAINWVIRPFHIWLYKRVYRQAREKWPHLAQEIYRGADFRELLGVKLKKHSAGYYLAWWPEWDKEPKED